MMFGRSFSDRYKGLRDLIKSFANAFDHEKVEELLEYVDHGEPGLALEMLSDWIYENDFIVSADQQRLFVIESDRYGIDPKSHRFLGCQPPYQDLRTAEQIDEEKLLTKPSLDRVRLLARTGRTIVAVRMYRQLTGAGSEESLAAVERMV